MNQTFLVMQLSANDDSLARREKGKLEVPSNGSTPCPNVVLFS
jgi:hypothetical protein